ncbi:hypothetical protein TrVFT333_003714 [Trichoderma virens FT-333]|nr:hypothetical protein TrVFT333_003714 [Trichoderma virens FT-333]
MESNPMIRCQCEAISFRAVLPKPLSVDICHCLECQRQSSSAFGVSAIFPVEGMLPFPESIQPHVGMWTRKTDSGCTLECYFSDADGQGRVFGESDAQGRKAHLYKNGQSAGPGGELAWAARRILMDTDDY